VVAEKRTTAVFCEEFRLDCSLELCPDSFFDCDEFFDPLLESFELLLESFEFSLELFELLLESPEPAEELPEFEVSAAENPPAANVRQPVEETTRQATRIVARERIDW
jgi:hypothetical protein